MSQYPLFVYGTLRPGNDNYPSYFAGRVQHEERATLTGAALYTEGVYPYLTIEPGLCQPFERVIGTLVYPAPEHYAAVLRDVDELEDYVAGRSTNWYERVVQRVDTAHGRVEAYVYVAGAQVIEMINNGQMMRVQSEEWHASA